MDAQYLHQKLSALKNVGAPPTMLETVISEKSFASKELPPPVSQPPAQPQVQTQAQRFKGMLGRANSLNFKNPVFGTHVEKALPLSPAPPPPPPTSIVSPPAPEVEASPSPVPALPTPSIGSTGSDLTVKTAPSPDATPELEEPRTNGVSNGDAHENDKPETSDIKMETVTNI